MKYRKKPVVVEAHQFESWDTLPDWVRNSPNVQMTLLEDKTKLIIKTLEGDMKADYGDYIIQGIKGELYPCKPDIFEETYEPVEEKLIMKWIKDKEQLPEIIEDKEKFLIPRSEDVLIYCEDGYNIGYIISGNRWYTKDGECEHRYVTHWQPLPEPPKE